MKTKNILVVGDAILDKYVEGSVTRISPEAPIPILDKQKTYYRLGGALNVAKNISSLGGRVWVISRIGKDSGGNIIKKLLSKDSIMPDLLLVDANIPTTVKTRFVSGNQTLLRVDQEDKTCISKTEMKELIHADLERHARYFDAIILSDYNKGVVYEELIQDICYFSKQASTICIADTHKSDIAPFKEFTCITPNIVELEKITGKSFKTLAEIKEAAKNVKIQNSLKSILVTLSEKGLLLIDSTNAVYHIPADKKDIIDVTGCGDTLVAAFTLFLAEGNSEQKSAYLANKAAGIVATKFGTAVCSRKELKLDTA